MQMVEHKITVVFPLVASEKFDFLEVLLFEVPA